MSRFGRVVWATGHGLRLLDLLSTTFGHMHLRKRVEYHCVFKASGSSRKGSIADFYGVFWYACNVSPQIASYQFYFVEIISAVCMSTLIKNWNLRKFMRIRRLFLRIFELFSYKRIYFVLVAIELLSAFVTVFYQGINLSNGCLDRSILELPRKGYHVLAVRRTLTYARNCAITINDPCHPVISQHMRFMTRTLDAKTILKHTAKAPHWKYIAWKAFVLRDGPE